MIDVEANLDSYDTPERVLCACGCGRLIPVAEWEELTGRMYDPRPLMPRAFWVRKP